jgi:hypothetical protein
MAADDEVPSEEALWLRENFNDEALGRYRDMWIAVKGRGVAAASPDLDDLLAETIGMDPLYAFVALDPLQ